MNCKEATLLLEKQIQENKSWFSNPGLWIHVQLCKKCKLFFEQSKKIDLVIEDILFSDNENLKYKLDDVFKESVKQKLKNS